MRCVHVQATSRDGLGFPIALVAMGVSAAVSYVRKRKKASKAKQLQAIQAREAVQQIYLELLDRDPWGKTSYDPGAEGWVTCLTDGSCDVDWVRESVLKSDEWRERELRRAREVYGGGGSALVPAGGVVVPVGGSPGAPPPAELFGIPIGYLAAGLVLLMALKR